MISVQRIFKLFLKEVRVQKYINIMSYAFMIQVIFITLEFSKFGFTHTRRYIIVSLQKYVNKIIFKICIPTTYSLIAYLTYITAHKLIFINKKNIIYIFTRYIICAVYLNILQHSARYKKNYYNMTDIAFFCFYIIFLHPKIRKGTSHMHI